MSSPVNFCDFFTIAPYFQLHSFEQSTNSSQTYRQHRTTTTCFESASTGAIFRLVRAQFSRHFTDSRGYSSTRLLQESSSQDFNFFIVVYVLSSLSQRQRGYIVYMLLVQKCVFICNILVIVKGVVQVDCGRRTGCLLGDLQFDYERCTVFSLLTLCTFFTKRAEDMRMRGQ